MADRTLTINHADGGSETYTLKTEDVLGVRSMTRTLGVTEGDPENITGFNASLGTWTKTSDLNGKVRFLDSTQPNFDLYWDSTLSQWKMIIVAGTAEFTASGDTEYPWDADWGGNVTFSNFVGGSVGVPITDTVSIDRTAPDLTRSIIIDGQAITIDDTREGLCTLTIDGEEITINRTEAANVASFLQEFTGAAAAYSLRDLAGSGNTTVVRVRRSSDNAEADFKAFEVSNGTLTTWVGAGNDGFVETWYDQSGNGNDAVQQVSGSQPKIVDAGVFLGEVRFDGNDLLSLTGEGLNIFRDVGYGHLFAVVKPDVVGTGTKRYFAARAGSAGARFILGDSNALSSGSRLGARRLDSDSFHPITSSISHGNSETLMTGLVSWADASAHLYFNGTEVASETSFLTAGNTQDTASSVASIGGETNLLTSTFKCKELIIYTSDQSANREAIETNINNQYSIY